MGNFKKNNLRKKAALLIAVNPRENFVFFCQYDEMAVIWTSQLNNIQLTTKFFVWLQILQH